jgi:hypothetical protein
VGSFESMCCVAEGMEVGVRQNTWLERGCKPAFGVGVLLTAILFLFMGLSSFLPAFVELKKSGGGFRAMSQGNGRQSMMTTMLVSLT